MSEVTNVLVSTEFEEDGELIANWLLEHYGGNKMQDLCHFKGIGGQRNVEANLRVGAFNYFYDKEFYSAAGNMALAGEIRVFLQKQHEDVLTLRLVLP